MTENKLPEVTPKLEEIARKIFNAAQITAKPYLTQADYAAILRPFITPASTPTEKLRKLADWLKGWELIEGSPENQALHIAIDQLFDPEENGEILKLLAIPATPTESVREGQDFTELARNQLDAEYDAALKEYNSRDLHVGIFPSRRQWFAEKVVELKAELLAASPSVPLLDVDGLAAKEAELIVSNAETATQFEFREEDDYRGTIVLNVKAGLMRFASTLSSLRPAIEEKK